MVQEATSTEYYNVLLVDSGKTAEVHLNYLRRLTADFAGRGHPIADGSTCYAVKCCLAGIQPATEDGYWPQDVQQRLVDTVRGYHGQFVALKPSWEVGGGTTDGVILVHVRIGAARGDTRREVVATCINQLMVESGDAVLDQGTFLKSG